jgi:hypothetical protein
MSYVDSYAELREYRTELSAELRELTKKKAAFLSEIKQTNHFSVPRPIRSNDDD